MVIKTWHFEDRNLCQTKIKDVNMHFQARQEETKELNLE